MFLSEQVLQTSYLKTRKAIMDRALLNMGESWKVAVDYQLTCYFKETSLKEKPLTDNYYKKLIDFLEEEYGSDTPIYPPRHQVFSWTHHCRIQDVKVVILGQDPYHKPGEAHGLCFSVPEGVDQPPSLQTIFEELKSDIPGFKIPNDGDLTKWAKQGVLLLNSVLTFRKDKDNSNSHNGKGWEDFTDAVIKLISSKLNNVVFMLWGRYAQEKVSEIDENRHKILEASHPSPKSAYEGYWKFPQPGKQPTKVKKFMGCGHFSKANDYLSRHGKTGINWNL